MGVITRSKIRYYERMKTMISEMCTAGLAKTGRTLAKEMKHYLERPGADGFNRIDKGELRDSITFAIQLPKTSKYFPHSSIRAGNPTMDLVGPAAPPESVIDPAKRPFLLKIGTKDKKARHIEFGTKGHKTDLGHEEFIRNITDWALRHGYDLSTTEGQDKLQHLIDKIRRQGTSAHPFVRPTRSIARETAKADQKAAFIQAKRRMKTITRYIGAEGAKVRVSTVK